MDGISHPRYDHLPSLLSSIYLTYLIIFILGFAIAIFSLPMFMFPRQFKGAPVDLKKEEEEASHTVYTNSISFLLLSLLSDVFPAHPSIFLVFDTQRLEFSSVPFHLRVHRIEVLYSFRRIGLAFPFQKFVSQSWCWIEFGLTFFYFYKFDENALD